MLDKISSNNLLVIYQLRNIMNFYDLVTKKTIDLWGKRLRDEELDVVIEVIRKSEVLEELGLIFNQLTLADGKFTDALAHNNTLNKLSLTFNNIGAEGAKRLADALKVSKTLKQLILGHNEIGAEGAKHIADALMENETLEFLNLHQNKIGNEGATSLASCLMVNQSMRNVNLQDNNITDDGAKKLIEALKWNYGIKDIFMWDPISERVKAKIDDLLADPKRKVPNSLLKHVREEVDTLKAALAAKERRIESIRSPLEQLRNFIDPVDLTGDENEPSNKRPRVGSTIKSNLSIVYQQNQQHTQRLVQVKQEKSEAETNLRGIQVEKEVMEANLNDTREDLEDANDLVQQQLLATDNWQGRFDEVTNLVLAGQADGAAIAEIRNRPLVNGN